MTVAAPKIVNRAADPRPVAALQCSSAMSVSSPHDAAEREAAQTAARIVRMPQPMHSPYVAPVAGRIAQRAPAIARQSDGQPNVSANLAAEIASTRSSGSPLPLSVRRFMEPRFGARFDSVKVQTDERAARMSGQLAARAFTVGNQIYFGAGRFQPESREGKELIAHELTHTIQQGAAEQGAAVRRSEDVTVSERTGPQVQREGGGWLDPTGYIARKAAAYIPGFTFFTVVIGYNPVTRESVDRNAGNLLRGAIQMMPGGAYITQALDNHGVFDKVSRWVAQKFEALRDIGSSIWQAIKTFIKGLSVKDLGDLDGVWERGKVIIAGPVALVKAFAIGLASEIVAFIKDVILKPIGAYARTTSGYPLLCSVLGHDPITGERAPDDPEALIGGFMKFIHEDAIWEKMQQAKAVPRAAAWFKSAVAGVKSFVSRIPGLFVAAFKALDVMDIIIIPLAFAKLAGVFGGFAMEFFKFAGKAMWDLLEIVFDVVAPGTMAYIKRTGAALKGILKDPIPFMGNLVKAGRLGFDTFKANFATHLKAGLIEWLVGALPGVYIPKALTLAEVGKLALSVLGITWAQIRGKIVKALGKNGETIMKGLETAFDIVVALVTGGPAAAWNLIKEKLTNLADTVIGGITGMVVDMVVKVAIPKILAMFIPGAGFIAAIVSIYGTITAFVARLARFAQVVKAFVDSIVDIAGGVIGAAAKRVEFALAGMLSLAISLLAGFAGLGNVAEKVLGVIARVRGAVDGALDQAIAWIVAKAKALFAKLFGKDKKDDDPEKAEKLKAGLQALDEINAQYEEGSTVEELEGPVAQVKEQHPVFTSLTVIEEDGNLIYDYAASPGEKKDGPVDGNRAYRVDAHPALKPDGVKMAGESHHVPAKVLQNWIGEVLVVAGRETENPALEAKGEGMVADKEGVGLAAIWLSAKNHDAAHESSASEPGDFETEKNEIIVQTRAGKVSSKPMKTTVASSVHEKVIPEGSDADTKEKMNKEIYAKFSWRLGSLFRRVHAGLLSTGLAGVENAKLKDGKWKGALNTLGKDTWKDKLDPKAGL